MGKSKETFGKKEVRKKKLKKRKEKEKRKSDKKDQEKKSLDEMIAYVNENGVITSTPPDLTNKEEVDADRIEIGIPKKEFREDNAVNQGIVTKFDDSKGYGFIIDSITKNTIFFHINDSKDNIKNGDKVVFDTEKGVKGLKAINVKVIN